MLRSILAAVVGFIAMMVGVVAGLTGLFAALGTERSYQPGSWEASTTFGVGMIIVGLLTAAIGVAIARLIDRKGRCDLILIGLILASQVASVVMQGQRPDPGERPEVVSAEDAQNKSITPVYVTVLYTLGEIAIVFWLGRRMRRH